MGVVVVLVVVLLLVQVLVLVLILVSVNVTTVVVQVTGSSDVVGARWRYIALVMLLVVVYFLPVLISL